ncbi:thioredoxin 1 [Elusimicrobium simillimum]|uniref:thioredoxin family protein n=1 Tax=Elusimicrobium simillimum TaxID=3143438 RepID=UPI003C6FAE44
MSEHILTDETFDTEIAAATTPFMVEFFATWCGHCKRMAPIIKEVSAELEGKVKIFIADVDVATKKTTDFGVSATPTMVLFKDGKPVKEIVGERSKEDLIKELEALL